MYKSIEHGFKKLKVEQKKEVKKNIELAAQQLRNAAISAIACDPIRTLIGSTNIEDAYAVQELNTQHRIEKGAKIAGHKIGLTAPVVQKQLGVDQPDFGVLWNDMQIPNGTNFSVQNLMQPKVEAELAFVLGKNINSENITEKEIILSVEYVYAAIEVVGSRIKNWDIKITDTIADNASASHWILGDKATKIEQIDLLNCKMQMKKNGVMVSEGIGRNCLGSPVKAAQWLIKKLLNNGKTLKKGEIILTGALGPMVNINAGDFFEVTIENAGTVSVKFVL